MIDQQEQQMLNLAYIVGIFATIIYLFFTIRMMYQVSQIKKNQSVILKKLKGLEEQKKSDPNG